MPQARRRLVPCGHAPPFGGPGGRAPLRGDGRGHSPSRGVWGKPPPQRVSRTDNSSPPKGAQTRVPSSHARILPPQVQKRNSRSCRRQEGGSPGVQPPPALAAGKRAARPGCTPPPALAAGKKAARPGCNPLPPLPQARRRLVPPGHGPARPAGATRPVRGG